MPQLPDRAIIKGSITDFDSTGFEKSSINLKLDKSLSCELSVGIAGRVIETERKGNTLTVFEVLKNYKNPLHSYSIGQEVAVSGILKKKANGSIILTGTIVTLVR